MTTARASEAEVFQRLDRLAETREAVLYLTAGSQYTASHQAASRWKIRKDQADMLRILDSSAASGQLALLALVCARKARQCREPWRLLEFANIQARRCKEYIFLDTLKYLAIGGRMSKVGAFLGNVLGIKPVIEHKPDGAGKAAVVRTRQAGLEFALERLKNALGGADGERTVLLEYTDTESLEFVKERVVPSLRSLWRDPEILVWPMSATAGVHMGPGTWGLAFTWS